MVRIGLHCCSVSSLVTVLRSSAVTIGTSVYNTRDNSACSECIQKLQHTMQPVSIRCVIISTDLVTLSKKCNLWAAMAVLKPWCRHPVSGTYACSKILKRSLFRVLSRTIFEKLPLGAYFPSKQGQFCLFLPIQGQFFYTPICAKTRASFKGQYFHI